ncbi:hypothetical protein BT93_E0881 [Corymbia citriodora subsp. variegata]|nr:hypothetical protein BT93_E0881 [Corymbia citriodora subsp. variegata]
MINTPAHIFHLSSEEKMCQPATTEVATVMLQVDSSSLEDGPMAPCKWRPPTDGAAEGVSSLKPDKYDALRKVGAEFVGTFFLILCAVGGPIVNQKYGGAETLLGNAACSGLAVAVMVFSIGHISGAHLNPSVTIALAVIRHFPWIQVPSYMAAQVAGSMCASYVLKGVFHPFANGGVTVPSVNIGQAFALEFLATFMLAFVIVAVATDTRAVGDLAGIAIGTTVLLGVLVTGMPTGGSLNPVRTLGPAVAAGNYKGLWMYMVAPPLGAIAGAVTYKAVKLKGYEAELPRQRRTSFRR